MDKTDLAQLSRETDDSEPGGSTPLVNEMDLLRREVLRLRAALPAPPFVEPPAISDWTERLPRHPSDQYETRSPADIERLVIHHSAAPPEVGPELIAHFQVDRRGWPAIGYHYFITVAGEVCQTNDLSTVCYHVREQSGSGIGICLAGRFDDAPPPESQVASAARLCAHLCGRLGLHARLGAIVGHGELMETNCPGEQWGRGVRWRDRLLTRITEVQSDAKRRRERAYGHFLLFWQDAGGWDVEAWEAAQEYIGRFRPVCGFSLEAASQADYVTIVGDEAHIPPAVEDYLRAVGCVVERIRDGQGASLREMFAGMVRRNQRFLTIGL